MNDFDTSFILAGCACQPNSMSWCALTNKIVFAIKTDIGLIAFDENENHWSIVETAFAHSSKISCIKFIKCDNEESDLNFFLTGSSCGETCLWKLTSNANLSCISLIKRFLKISEFSITYVGGYFTDSRIANGIVMFAHSNTISFCQINDDTINSNDKNIDKNMETLKFSKNFALSFDLLAYDDILLLAVGLTNGDVEIFYKNKSEFVHSITLTQQLNKWTRALAFSKITSNSNNLFMLASASDEIIRIWTFKNITEKTACDNNKLEVRPILLKINQEDSKEIVFETKLDSVLNEHNNWIFSLCWHPKKMYLISSSMDKHVILWEFVQTNEYSLWLPKTRMGEIGGEAVGFYDALFSPDGSQILFHSFFGAFLLWNICEEKTFAKSFPISGHFDCVTDFDWGPNGNYIVSCALDKTTRIFAPLKKNGKFVEISRPQVHGHSLMCIKSISSVCFVSGAEEKIFRVFQAPVSFFENLKSLCGITLDEKTNLIYAASLPQLGLSNKAIASCEDYINFTNDKNGYSIETEQALDGGFNFSEPPRDDQLLKYSLFPEIQKLYGHGFEVFTVTSNHSQTLIATSCKASHEEHATILIWDTIEWHLRSTIKAHQLTVTQLSFSPNDQFLLSVSRDRSWNLYKKLSKPYEFVVCVQSQKQNDNHTRIIWSCAWSHDSKYFVTASRDKLLNIWKIFEFENDNIQVNKLDSFISSDSITAIDFAPKLSSNGSYIIALGQDNGELYVVEWYAPLLKNNVLDNFVILKKLNQSQGFSSTVNRIRFRPSEKWQNSNKNIFEFCCCSNNQIIKMYRFIY